MSHNSKTYQDYVFTYTLEKIKTHFQLETKKEAKEYFFKALAFNTVQAELFERIEWLINENE